MAATRRRSKRDLHIVVTESDNTVTSLLVARTPGAAIRKNPITGLGQVVTTGDTSERSDQRTPQVIYKDQTAGMGEFFYTETEGVSTFTDSECDTRYPGMICLPPARTSLGLCGVVTSVYEYRIEYTGLAAARLIAWFPTAAAVSPVRLNAGTWTGTGLTGINTVYAYTTFRSYYIFATGMANGLWYSTNATAWTNLAYAKTMRGACVHDNKLYIWNATDQRLEWHTDPTTAVGWATSTATFYPLPNEAVCQLFEWRDRVGRAIVYILTNKRLFSYDEDADVYQVFHDFSQQVGDSGLPQAHAWRKTGDLYVVFGNIFDKSVDDRVLWFSGTTGTVSPNARGGMPSAKRVSFDFSVGGLTWLFFFGRQRYVTLNTGQVLAMNDQQAFHSLGQGQGGGKIIAGGGYAQGLLWTAMVDGTIYEQEVRDNTDLPLFLESGERVYPATGTYNHEFALTDGGTPNMDKQWLWVAVTCLDHTSGNKVPGLAANTQVIVNGRADTDTGWTTLGTLTSASTFPAILPINSGFGVSARQYKIQLALSSTATNNTPIVSSVALAYVRQEVPRYAYTVPIDLTDRLHPLYKGKSVAGLLAAMDRWTQPGAIVKLQFAGGDYGTAPSTSTTVPNCTFAYSGVEDAERGPDKYQGIFADFRPPASG